MVGVVVVVGVVGTVVTGDLIADAQTTSPVMSMTVTTTAAFPMPTHVGTLSHTTTIMDLVSRAGGVVW